MCDVASGVYAKEYTAAEALGAVPYLRVNNVREYIPNLTARDLKHVVPHESWGSRVCISAGDVVISRTGTLGRAFLATHEIDGAVMSQHVTRLRMHDSGNDKALLIAAYLNSEEGKAQILSVASGSTRLELTHENILETRIPRRILEIKGVALRLGDIQAMLRTSLAGYVNASQGCSKLVPPASNPESFFSARFDGPSFKRTLAPRFHEPNRAAIEEALQDRYECLPLGEIALVKRGAGSRAVEYEGRGVPYIRTSSVVNYGIELFPEHYGAESTYHAHSQGVGPGDILLTMEGKIGLVALLGQDERCIIKNHIEFIRLHKSSPVPPEFVYALLSSYIGQTQIARRVVVQATIPGLGAASRSILIPVAGRSKAAERKFQQVMKQAVPLVRSAAMARAKLRSGFHWLRDATEGALAH